MVGRLSEICFGGRYFELVNLAADASNTNQNLLELIFKDRNEPKSPKISDQHQLAAVPEQLVSTPSQTYHP